MIATDELLRLLSQTEKNLSDEEHWYGPQPIFLDPYEFYSICPECHHWDLSGTQYGGACLKCSWKFSVVKLAV